jgi:hypothetical protein
MVDQTAKFVIESLEKAAIPYMLVGAYSSGAYAVPRATKDVDLVISIESVAILTTFAEITSSELTFDDQITFETITGSLRYILTSKRNKALKVELFLLGEDPFVQERFSRRQQYPVPQLGCDVWLPTAEDVIIQKLRWARSKDLDDARDVLAVQGEEFLDMAYIEKWCETHGTLEKLRAIQASIPPL